MANINSWKLLMCVSLLSSLILLIVMNNEHIYGQQDNGTAKIVHAGEGNASAVIVAFIPDNIEVNAGDSVQWINPTEVAEPHSVTFLGDKKYFADFAAPFRIDKSTDLKPLIPESNSEPVFPPSEPGNTTKSVILVNARAILPTVIDSSGEKTSYLPLNSNYVMNGTESYVNSGWLWPEGMAPAGGPPISKFTVTFEKTGTYSYLCNVHPWMTGSVKVK
jgi:plastocyanin